MLRLIRRWKAKRTLPYRVVGSAPPAWTSEQTAAYPRVGRLHELTLAGEWRANGGRW